MDNKKVKEDLKKDVESLQKLVVKRFNDVRSDNNTLVLVVCILVSTLFWFLKALNDNYSTEVEFPIEFTNVPSRYTLSGELPDRLIATVEDDGFTIMRYKFAFVFSSFKFDVSKNFKKKDENSDHGELVITQSALKKGVSDVLISHTNLKSVYPETVTINYSKQKEKRVPIHVVADISTEQQHIINGAMRTTPDSITIIGSKQRLDEISQVDTRLIKAYDLTDTLRRKVELSIEKDLIYSQKRVSLVIPVETFTEKNVEVAVIGINFPDSLRLRTFPGVATISTICGLSSYNKIYPSDFICFVDYQAVKDASNGHVNLNVTSVNSLAQRVTLRTRSVDYLIEKKK